MIKPFQTFSGYEFYIMFHICAFIDIANERMLLHYTAYSKQGGTVPKTFCSEADFSYNKLGKLKIISSNNSWTDLHSEAIYFQWDMNFASSD